MIGRRRGHRRGCRCNQARYGKVSSGSAACSAHGTSPKVRPAPYAQTGNKGSFSRVQPGLCYKPLNLLRYSPLSPELQIALRLSCPRGGSPRPVEQSERGWSTLATSFFGLVQPLQPRDLLLRPTFIGRDVDRPTLAKLPRRADEPSSSELVPYRLELFFEIGMSSLSVAMDSAMVDPILFSI